MPEERPLTPDELRQLREQVAVIRRKAEEGRRAHAEVLIAVDRADRILGATKK